jgi:hypothetical protein
VKQIADIPSALGPNWTISSSSGSRAPQPASSFGRGRRLRSH